MDVPLIPRVARVPLTRFADSIREPAGTVTVPNTPGRCATSSIPKMSKSRTERSIRLFLRRDLSRLLRSARTVKVSYLHFLGRDIGQIHDRRGAHSHGNRDSFADFFLSRAVFQGLLDVSFQTSLAMSCQGCGYRDQFLGFSIESGGFVSLLIKLEIDLPHSRLDHRV